MVWDTILAPDETTTVIKMFSAQEMWKGGEGDYKLHKADRAASKGDCAYQKLQQTHLFKCFKAAKPEVEWRFYTHPKTFWVV